MSFPQFNITGVITQKLDTTRLADIKNIKVFTPIISLAMALESLLVFFRRTQINLQAQDTVVAFTREYSRVSYLSIGKQWLKKLIVHHHVSTNLYTNSTKVGICVVYDKSYE
jgi:hypothetical protein